MNPIKNFMASSERVYVAIFVCSVLILVMNLLTLILSEMSRDLVYRRVSNLEYRISIVEQAQKKRLQLTGQPNEKSISESSEE